jgi:hypothetical protein
LAFMKRRTSYTWMFAQLNVPAGGNKSVIAKHYDFVKYFLNTSDVLIDNL